MSDDLIKTKVTNKDYNLFMDDFKKTAKPLIEFLNRDGLNPHYIVVVDSCSAELLSGCIAIRDESFLKD